VTLSRHPHRSRLSVPGRTHYPQHPAPVSPLAATLMDLLVSVANKRLTPRLNLLDATLTKNRGVAAKETELGSTCCFAFSCRSLHQECFSSLLRSIPSTLFLKIAGVSPNNSHSGTHCASPARIAVLSFHKLTNAPSRKPLRLTSLQMPGGYRGEVQLTGGLFFKGPRRLLSSALSAAASVNSVHSAVSALIPFLSFDLQLSTVNRSERLACPLLWKRSTIGCLHFEEGSRHGHC
jgi:hypothetical protein